MNRGTRNRNVGGMMRVWSFGFHSSFVIRHLSFG
jgi:hypothetical protein